jgi:hypothetical protein
LPPLEYARIALFRDSPLRGSPLAQRTGLLQLLAASRRLLQRATHDANAVKRGNLHARAPPQNAADGRRALARERRARRRLCVRSRQEGDGGRRVEESEKRRERHTGGGRGAGRAGRAAANAANAANAATSLGAPAGRGFVALPRAAAAAATADAADAAAGRAAAAVEKAARERAGCTEPAQRGARDGASREAARRLAQRRRTQNSAAGTVGSVRVR